MPFINLDEFDSREIIQGYRGVFIHSENLTLAYWTIDAGAVMPEHSHPHEQVANILEGEFELVLDGESKVLRPGMVAMIPAGMPHGGRALIHCRILDVFHPVREDYKMT
jgi:quercetin dioxygenase-like cupin family protein